MAKKQKVYEVRRMRNSGSYHHFFRESGTTAWKHHNWDGPAIEPIEGEITELKKSYFLYGIEMTKDEWIETRSEREGLPWYKSAALRGTARM
jgi:hypothetical protein|tara:strand:- start:45 stop:320 length:276 start_codon:yes stop_codon:yes gene_type:complete